MIPQLDKGLGTPWRLKVCRLMDARTAHRLISTEVIVFTNFLMPQADSTRKSLVII